MLTRLQSVAIIVCLLYVPQFTYALSRRLALNKRSSDLTYLHSNTKLRISLKPNETRIARYNSIVVSCEVDGRLYPTIHWLKNGERVQQGTSLDVQGDAAFENAVCKDQPRLQLTLVKSMLYIDCITEETEYTCVGETRFARVNQSLRVFIDPGSSRDDCAQHNDEKPARIYMTTWVQLDYVGDTVRLYCRAEGKPTPTITWHRSNNESITNVGSYRIANNGDLIIVNPTWGNMDKYECKADNGVGSDTAQSFFYPLLST
ncbi:neural/ectodermal development factor IMP-L2 [Biomphalaria pfeifferi]|uniref:Neural/ectodermal development factor IMP-L2 n=1 Tax=Biomphalaria pfeifferi TaxID=112525 RepID=A0AAD8BIP4_BIOPF|nr:neural/ectodermal development factor IMP-L2 [Biomphalaria pfeifferi]